MFTRKQQDSGSFPSQPGSNNQRPKGILPARPNKATPQSPDTDSVSQSVISNQQLVLITQLMQITMTMHQINELFLWLARAMVQRLNVQVVQFWTNQEAGLSPSGLELQRTACQNDLLPPYVIVNDQVTQIVRQIAEKRFSALRQPVGNLFAPQHATTLQHYNLNYCTAYCQYSNTWYASANYPHPTGQLPAPFMVVAFLFFQQPPSQQLHVSIEHILEQALLAARNQGLLHSARPPEQKSYPVPPAPTETHHPTSPIQRPVPPSWTTLIPRRIDDINMMRSSNPLANSVDIGNKQARRLYAAVDGRKNLTELSLVTRLTVKELIQALQALVVQQRLRLYTPTGEPMDDLKTLETL